MFHICIALRLVLFVFNFLMHTHTLNQTDLSLSPSPSIVFLFVWVFSFVVCVRVCNTCRCISVYYNSDRSMCSLSLIVRWRRLIVVSELLLEQLNSNIPNNIWTLLTLSRCVSYIKNGIETVRRTTEERMKATH